MIDRSKRVKINPIDDAALVICQVCGENLTITKDGISYCSKCGYYCRTISSIPEDYSIRCMVCGTKIQSGKLCDKCKETMLSVKNQLISKNFQKDT